MAFVFISPDDSIKVEVEGIKEYPIITSLKKNEDTKSK